LDRARISIEAQRGTVLMAAVGVLAILALAYFALFAKRQSERALRVGTTSQARLDKVDSALAQFVARQRRLPCPASGALRDGAIGAGQEQINLSTGQCIPATQSDGIVPWATLGLVAEQAADAWNGRITYRVQPSLASNLLTLMNMSWCTGAGATGAAPAAALACTPAPCTGANCMDSNNYLYAKGLQVQDGAGGWLNRPAPAWTGAPAPPPASSGAAYVLVAHGANGAGAYNASGVLQAGAPAPGTDELANRNGVALTGTTVFIDKAPASTPTTAYYDDLLSHPTLSQVLQRAALGPRVH
jgi:hypothetical protein